MSIPPTWLQIARTVCIALLVRCSCVQVHGEDVPKTNQDKVRVMCKLVEPRTQKEMDFQIEEVDALFPDRLAGDQFGEDDVVVRTAIFLSTLLDSLVAHPEFQTEQNVSRLVNLLTKYNRAIKAALIPNFKLRLPADMNVVAPPGSGIMNGGDPAAINDPVIRKKYLALIDRNDRNIAINNLQMTFYRQMTTLEAPTLQILNFLKDGKIPIDKRSRAELSFSRVKVKKREFY